tara:strand:- start:2354 stop:3130 length:777 start_codon:yes stop_codon:yes gene_type:complete
LKNQLTVYKIGGKIIDNPTHMKAFLFGIKQSKGHKIIVHGGGNTASKVMNQIGLKPKMIDGRRITDAAALEIVTMVYGGLINKRLVAQLQSIGVNAIGLSGADGDIIRAHKREVREIDYGWVGDIDEVNGKALSAICKNENVPVICPLTHDGNGHMLNTNADTIASQVAIALAQEFDIELVFCFELKGVLSNYDDKQSVIPEISRKDAAQMHNKGIINDGMIPKLKNGFDALEGGVRNVFIKHVEDINDINAGTTLDL